MAADRGGPCGRILRLAPCFMGLGMTISLHNLTVGYDRHPALHHISGTFPAASLTALIGPNGGGKSTLLKALMNFLPPQSGHIDFNGILPSEIAYLPQISEVDRSFPLSVSDVVQLGYWPEIGAFRGITKTHRDTALKALDQVGMASYAERPIATLSTGQWQRVLFARLSLQNAHVLLLDEPFAAIDSRTTHDLIHILQQWNEEGRIVIAAMHDLPLVREHFPSALMIAREVIAWGPTQDVLADINLAKAQHLAGHWVEHANECLRDERA